MKKAPSGGVSLVLFMGFMIAVGVPLCLATKGSSGYGLEL